MSTRLATKQRTKYANKFQEVSAVIDKLNFKWKENDSFCFKRKQKSELHAVWSFDTPECKCIVTVEYQEKVPQANYLLDQMGLGDEIAHYVGYHWCYRISNELCQLFNISDKVRAQFSPNHFHWGVEPVEVIASEHENVQFLVKSKLVHSTMRFFDDEDDQPSDTDTLDQDSDAERERAFGYTLCYPFTDSKDPRKCFLFTLLYGSLYHENTDLTKYLKNRFEHLVGIKFFAFARLDLAMKRYNVKRFLSAHKILNKKPGDFPSLYLLSRKCTQRKDTVFLLKCLEDQSVFNSVEATTPCLKTLISLSQIKSLRWKSLVAKLSEKKRIWKRLLRLMELSDTPKANTSLKKFERGELDSSSGSDSSDSDSSLDLPLINHSHNAAVVDTEQNDNKEMTTHISTFSLLSHHRRATKKKLTKVINLP